MASLPSDCVRHLRDEDARLDMRLASVNGTTLRVTARRRGTLSGNEIRIPYEIVQRQHSQALLFLGMNYGSRARP